MTDGDLITQRFQFEYNGLLMGPNTNYDLVEIEGLDMLPVREGDEPRPGDHGNFDLTADLFPARVVQISLEVISTSFTDIQAMQTAFRDRSGTHPLVFQLHDDIKKRVNCRVRRRQINLDPDVARGDFPNVIQFWAPDPRVYANAPSSSATSASTPVVGFDFPLEFPIIFGAITPGSVLCTNAGNMETRPVVTLTGTMTNPAVANLTTGIVWSSNISLAAGEQLVVDFDAKTLKLGGVTDRYGTFTGDWWTLVPGDNVIQLSLSSGNGTAQIAYRSAWDSAV